VGGCHEGECNYLYGNYSTEKRVTVLSQMLEFCGIEKERLRVKWVSSAEATEYVEEMNDFVSVLRKLGPSPLKNQRVKEVA
jgi:F420-non-reducing hydrogenase iron-sulfur subunit